MSDGKRRIDRILSEDYTSDLGSRSIEQIRAMREECAEEEAVVSYERRLLHGRLAVVRFEIDRRAGKAEGSVIDKLPQILGDEQGPSRGAFPGKDPNLEAFREPTRRISKLLSDDTLTSLPTLSDDELQGRLGALEEAEREVSDVRATLLPILDALSGEIGRRYKSGEADPSDALSKHRG